MHSTANPDEAAADGDATRVYTFYSFKGGVGRSMALANVAELLYRRGLRVLMIDFDLEAPGLERYFDVSEAETDMDGVLNRRGLMDLLVSYKALRSLPALIAPPPAKDIAPTAGGASGVGCLNIAESSFQLTDEVPAKPTPAQTPQTTDGFQFPYPVEPLANFIVPIYGTSTNGGELSLISAGRRSGEEFANYAKHVRTFNWDEFFNNWDGEKFFEWFRREAKRYADIVLVDSRTGVTEMSGVCSYQLADTVVMFVAPNYQNLDGSRRVARSLENPELIKMGRGGRPLWKLFVPSRVESGEGDMLDEFKSRFLRDLGELFPRHLKYKNDLFITLRVPYVPYYAYTERVAVRDAGHAKAADISSAIESLVAMLAQLEPPHSKLRQLYELPEEQTVDLRIEETFARFAPPEQRDVRRIFTRLVQVGSPDGGDTHTTFLRVSLRSFNSNEQSLIEKLAGQRLLIIEHDEATGDAVVRVRDENALLTWKRFNEWLEEDGEFLVWRQQTKANIDQWRTNGRDESFLLYGRALALAASWQERRGAELNESEIAFVSESRRHDQRLKDLENERQQQVAFAAQSAQQYQSVQQQKQRRTYLGAGVVVALMFFIMVAVGAGIYWWQSRVAENKLAIVESEQIELRVASLKSSGDFSFQNDDYAAAVDSYSQAIELKPDDAETYLKRGDVRLQLRQFDEALADYDAALKINANSAEAHYRRGLARSVRAHDGDLEAAVADFNRALELKSDYAEAYYQRGAAHEAARRFTEAADDYRNAVRHASIPAVQSEAQQALDELAQSGRIASTVPAATPPPAEPSILFHYNNPDDLAATRSVAKAVADKFPGVREVQLRGEATDGDVRYFYLEDGDNAAAVRDIVQRSLAARGIKLSVQVVFLGNLYRNVPRGQLEVWLPALKTDAKQNNVSIQRKVPPRNAPLPTRLPTPAAGDDKQRRQLNLRPPASFEQRPIYNQAEPKKKQ